MAFRFPPLNALRLFEAAGRLRSFSAAAGELGITPSAVSHGIQALEDWLGAALFVRKRGDLALTPAGAEYLRAIRGAFDLLAPGDSMPPSRGANVIRMTVVPTFASRLLIPCLPRFRALYPTLALAIDTRQDLLAFPDDGFDIGIRLGAGQWPGLSAEHLLTESLVPVCRPDFLREGQDIGSIPDEAIIHTTGIRDDWAAWAEGTGCRAPSPAHGLRVDTAQMALQAAAQGIGIAIGRLPAANRELESGTLIAASDHVVRCRNSYWLVSLPQTRQRMEIRIFCGWLLEQMRPLNEPYPRPIIP